MSKENQSTRLQRRTKAEVSKILAEYQQSDLSLSEFCKAKSLHKATFSKWISRSKLGSPKKRVTPGFAPVEVIQTLSPALFAEVNGIRIYQPVPAAFLKLLVK